MMEKFLIWAGFLGAFVQFLLFSFGASFETTVVGILLGLVFVATGAALAAVDARPGSDGSGETTVAPADDPSPARGAREGGVEDGA